jgi:MFS superfamily sulfate permease-like transporter
VFISSKYFCSVNTAANKEDDGTTFAVWHIVVSLVSGIIIGILLSYIVFCSRRRWFRNRNPEPQRTEVDTTYQELDLSKMNTEDNYQSLRNTRPQSNPEPKTTEANTTYQELDLSKMNTEDNYQSLRVNAASNETGNRAANDDDSTYTELAKTRDVEDNYQSLT